MSRTKRLISDYVDNNDWRSKENANTRQSVSGLYSRVAHQVFAEENIESIPHGDLHNSGELYSHDLGYPIQTVYCVGHDLYEILTKGITTAGGTKSKPAKHLDTAVDHIVNFLCMAQNECAGAQSFSNVSTLLAPFVRADNLTYTAIKQAVQRMVFSLNYENRIAFQQSFTNFTLDLKPAEVKLVKLC
jgi:ribonucleoside-triphosphate reductase (formate)